MKKAFAGFIVILLFVGIAAAPAYAKETILARVSGSISKQESVKDVVHRLVREAIEKARKRPCVLKAFEEGREVSAGVRVGVDDGKVTVEVVTEESCA